VRRVALLVGSALPLLLCVALCGCPALRLSAPQPEVHLKSVDLQQVDFQSAHLLANLEVTNNFPATLPVSRLDWTVKIEGNQLVGGVLPSPPPLAPQVATPVALPFELKFDDLLRIADRYRDQDTAPYRLEGSFSLQTPIGPLTLPFHHDGTIPLLHVPRVELGRVDVKQLGLDGATLTLGFRVVNPNGVALGLQKLDYALSLSGARVAEGGLPRPLDLPAKGEGTFDADVTLSFLQARQAAEAVMRGGEAVYAINGNLAATTPWGALATPYSKSGTVRVQR